MIYFRPATKNDLEIICLFPHNKEELFYFFPKAQFPLTLTQIEASVASRKNSTVALLDGDIVGFANFYIYEHQGRCAIGNVIVSPRARRLGVATALMSEMIRIAQTEYSAVEITVSCFNQNIAGLLLYPKLGFAPYSIEERVTPLGEKVALIHMKLSTREAKDKIL